MANLGAALWLDNDHNVYLSGVRKEDTGVYLGVTAVVTYRIETMAGVEVTSGSMSYVTASDGNYRAKVEATALSSLVEGDRYRLKATAAQDGYDGQWNLYVTARRRGTS